MTGRYETQYGDRLDHIVMECRGKHISDIIAMLGVIEKGGHMVAQVERMLRERGFYREHVIMGTVAVVSGN